MKKNSSTPFLSDTNQLAPDAFLDSFFVESNCTLFGWGPVLLYPSHTEIIRHDTPANAVYFIHRGLVKLTWMDQNGHEVIAGLRHQQWLIGAPSVLLGKTYSFTVTTLTDCALRCISAKNFIHLVKTHTEFSFQLTRILCQEIINHGNRLVILGCMSAKDRLKKLLYKFFGDMHKPSELRNRIKIQLPLNHKELAQIVAVTPEHLSRLLKELETQGVIKREKDGLILLDLFNIRQDCHG